MRHFIMHVRHASYGSAPPLNCGVIRMSDPSAPTEGFPVLSVESYLRRRSDMFFGPRGPNPEMIAGFIADGALILGARRTLVAEEAGWWYVCADVDWFAVQTRAGVNEDTVFQTIWAFPELGVNTNRWEVFARVFATRTFTIAGDRVLRVKGDLPPDAELKLQVASLGQWQRVVGFEFSASV
jgi:hypothetical protein